MTEARDLGTHRGTTNSNVALRTVPLGPPYYPSSPPVVGCLAPLRDDIGIANDHHRWLSRNVGNRASVPSEGVPALHRLES